MFWFSGHEAYGILVPQPGTEPAPLAVAATAAKSLQSCPIL